MNEYVTKFTNCPAMPRMRSTLMRRSKNGLNDGLAYTLEARDFENIQGMMNKALVLENHRGVMERKHKLVCQHQPGSSSRPCVTTPSARLVFCPAQPLF
jgi:hypothetical protein